MYQLVSAIGKTFANKGRWITVDAGGMTLADIYSVYSSFKITLTNPIFPQRVCLDMKDIRFKIIDFTVTFNQYLIDIADMTLPTSNVLPVFNTRYAKYSDVFRAGYSVMPVDRTASPDAELPPGAKEWLMLSRPNTDYTLFYNSCMVSVNGFFHYLDGNVNGVWVVDGMKSSTISNNNQISMLSFNGLGKLTYIPIKPSMVYKQNDRQDMSSTCYVNVGQDITNKTVILVIGGYMHLLDPKTFYRVGNNLLRVDFSNFPLLERYMESRKYIDMSSLPIERTIRNDSQIGIEDFMRDENIIAYMTLSQSFIVLLDNPDVFKEEQSLRTTPMPGMLISYVKPTWPLFNGVGKVADYWDVLEDGQWAISCIDNLYHNRIFDTVNPFEQNSVGDSRVPQDPAFLNRSYFLKIGADI